MNIEGVHFISNGDRWRRVKATTQEKRQYLIDSLQDKEYRDLYVAENIDTGIAFQVRAMRDAREWTQSELGARTGKQQEAIARIEDPNYGNYTLRTLKLLALAFDVALVVRFEPFSRFVDYITKLAPTDLAVPSFATDEGLHDNGQRATGAAEDAQP